MISKENNVNINAKFEEVEFHKILIEKMKKKPTLRLIKDISQMQSMKCYDVLKSVATSSDFEIIVIIVFELI